MSAIEVEVWWVPQVPMPEFVFKVPTVAEGRRMESMLAEYDLFQFEHKVKPDYCNAGGVRFRHAELTEGEWWEVDDDDETADIIENGRRRGIDVSALV